MRRWIPVILISALLAQAQKPQQEPIQRITHTRVFAFGGIGFAGQISEGENDFHFILKLPSAITHFETIYATGTPEAKSYALVGIRQVNRQRGDGRKAHDSGRSASFAKALKSGSVFCCGWDSNLDAHQRTALSLARRCSPPSAGWKKAKVRQRSE